jgi:hypothetical protein
LTTSIAAVTDEASQTGGLICVNCIADAIAAARAAGLLQ